MNNTAVSILYTIPNFITAGSGRAILNIVERLDRTKFAPAICVMRKGGNLDQEVERLGIPFLEAPFSIPARPYHTLLVRARRAAQFFHRYQFDLWHSFHYADDYTEPLISRLSGAKSWIYTKKNMSWHRRSWHVRTLLAARVAAQNTDMMREFFSGSWSHRKARLVPRGVNTACFHPDTPGRLHLREQLGVSPDVVVVGCVAHLVPVKGHTTLIAAVAQVPHMHLLIAGKPLDQKYAAALESSVQQLGIGHRVHFLGEVQDVPALIAELDIAVLPTWARWRMEGCPVALLEAMASGRACVATDIPGSRDLIEHGVSGWLVPPEDPDALARTLNRLSSDPAQRSALGLAARRRAVQYFTIEQEVKAHEELYAELVQHSHVRNIHP